ncbi:hypothetical protein ACFE04_007662 [Oxalis oulophora]
MEMTMMMMNSTTWLKRLKKLRYVTALLVIANVCVTIQGVFIVFVLVPACDRAKVFPIIVVSLAAVVKLAAMLKTAIAQEAIATSILHSSPTTNVAVADAVFRQTRRFFGAAYLLYHVAKFIYSEESSSGCTVETDDQWWNKKLFVSFIIMVSFIALAQCFIGSDVLSWRSFYATQNDVWKAHYHEVFDHGIREALCCLGRFKYLTVSEEDEVYSVAQLLGDLVVYRASGTGHLELLAGLALLQRESHASISYEEFPEAPVGRIQGAATFHKFAEAAYTGLLLDVGRHPILFPCAWLHRQGVLTPWARNRRPKLEGDNWWRGHAAAFLKHIDSSPDVLRRGRDKCEAAYFIVVLHEIKSVVISVRGTETPEDLITDGLGRECFLLSEDLDGLINNVHIGPDVRQKVESSFPHYGHSGIVETVRDLYLQIEGHGVAGLVAGSSNGFLSTLLGTGCECEGYSLRIAGHSLGGAIAALLGIRLYRQYPNLHVYSYGPLPCVDSVIADACSGFVTSIVLNNEFSSRLSVGSMLRLRAAAIMALSQDPKTDTALVFRLARRFLYVSKKYRSGETIEGCSEFHSRTTSADFDEAIYKEQQEQNQDNSLWSETNRRENYDETNNDQFVNPFAVQVTPPNNPVSQFLETVPVAENGSAGDIPELYLPGLVIHVVPQERSSIMSMWGTCGIYDGTQSYKAYVAKRESFSDIVVSPSMFLDHLPWRGYLAIQKILKARECQDMLNGSIIV